MVRKIRGTKTSSLHSVYVNYDFLEYRDKVLIEDYQAMFYSLHIRDSHLMKDFDKLAMILSRLAANSSINKLTTRMSEFVTFGIQRRESVTIRYHFSFTSDEITDIFIMSADERRKKKNRISVVNVSTIVHGIRPTLYQHYHHISLSIYPWQMVHPFHS